MISAVVLTKNEELSIKKCLHALEWCDEVIVIDDFSEDKTVEIVKDLQNKKIHVYSRHLKQDFAAQRNFALEKAQGEWILFVDADEIVSPSLQYEIVSTVNSNIDNFSGYFIKRVDTMWGKILKHGETGNITLLRLAKKNTGTWRGPVHERWVVTGNTGTLKNPLHHYPHQTITEYLQEINTYTDIRALELYNKNVKTYWWSIIIYPLAKCIKNYFLKFGIFDGIPGLVSAMMMSLHSFLVRGKLWWLWQKKRN